MRIGSGFLAILCLPIFLQSAEKFSCGEKKKVKRSYGNVEVRVDCELTKGRMWVAEFKGEISHGFSQGFDIASGRKSDSCFYSNDEKNGLSLVWDSLGNIVGRSTYRNGKYVGKREVYFAPGHPSLIKKYNAAGKADGPWDEWWKNGNKKAEYIAKNGEIISGAEYYQNGKPRARYTTKYEPKNMNVLKTKYIQAEAWAPNGKSTGKIVNGNGEWILFPDGKDTTDHTVFREIYTDSLLIKVNKLDSAEIAPWLKP